MRKELRRSIISGKAQPTPSISMAHRAIILASISASHTLVSGAPVSSSIDATVEACKRLGADIVSEEGKVDIIGADPVACPKRINCGTSAATLRLLMPFAMLFESETTFMGADSIGETAFYPHVEYLSAISSQELRGDTRLRLPVSLHGPINQQSIVYPGELGSQLLSGLLLSAPLSGDDFEIGIESHLTSWSAVSRTLGLMRQCGIESSDIPGRAIRIMGGQDYSPPDEIVVPLGHCEPSYLLLAGALCGKVDVQGVGIPDLLRIFSSFGATVNSDGDFVSVSAGVLDGAKIDISTMPEFLPHAMVLASAANSKSEIGGMTDLPQKQKRRALLLGREMSRLGARIEPTEDGMRIEGGRLTGAEVEPEGDAHTAMACSIAALAARGPTIINGAECIERQHPGFFRQLVTLGAIVRETF